MWPLLLLLHVIGQTGFNLVLRKALVNNVDRWTLATIMQTGITVPIVIAFIFVQPDWSVYKIQSSFIILITVFLIMSLHFTQVKALQYLEASVFPVFYNLRIIFTTVLGILFLSEEVLPLQIMGGLLIFLAVLTVRQKGKKELTALGVKWGLAAAVVISVLNMFEKGLITQIGFVEYVVPVMFLATIGMWMVLFYRKQRIPLSTFKQPQMLALMGLRTLSAYGATLAFWLGGTLSVTTYISSLGVITTLLFGAVLLNERDYLKNKVLAAAIAASGLTLIFFANLQR